MCGIVGLVGAEAARWVSEMNATQTHRGPDDEGLFRDDQQRLAMGMRRLSIVDLSEGHQPMEDASGRYVVVFNGEIFNAPRLRQELTQQGYRFRTKNSDTEILLSLFDRYQQEMVHHLVGMYAFVIYDKHNGILFGARDRVGIKPFYYTVVGGNFAFASELKSLLVLPWGDRVVDQQSVYHYLTFQFVPPPRSIFQGIEKLPAGHLFVYEIVKNRLSVKRYWEPPCRDEGSAGGYDDKELTGQLRSLLKEVVRDWLMSDVPVGCSLSGGIDSSAVVGLMADVGITDINTWSLGFTDTTESDLDERHLAREVAEKWSSRHHEIVIQADDLIGDLDAMVSHLDEPYGGGLPAWYVFRAMGDHVKVAMTGTGGDELFGNYGKWRVHEIGSTAWLRSVKECVRRQGVSQLLTAPHGALYHGYFSEREKRKFWCGKTNGLESSPSYVERIWQSAMTRDPRRAVTYVDMQLQLPEEFLLMTDRFSMAWSVEARTPLLDHRLIEFVLALPSRLRSNRENLKSFFVGAVGDLLPESIKRAPKRGFVLPMGQWLRVQLAPLVEEHLGMHALKRQGLFDTGIYTRFVVPHMAGRESYTWQLWTLLMFQLWWKKFNARLA